MSTITIYHNPACGTSRNTLGLIRNSGAEPVIIEYLVNPPDRATLVGLLAAMKLSPRDLLRRKGTPYDALKLDDPSWTDDRLIDVMVEHPILLERPIVVTPPGRAPVPSLRDRAGHPAFAAADFVHQGRRRTGRRLGRPAHRLLRRCAAPALADGRARRVRPSRPARHGGGPRGPRCRRQAVKALVKASWSARKRDWRGAAIPPTAAFAR